MVLAMLLKQNPSPASPGRPPSPTAVAPAAAGGGGRRRPSEVLTVGGAGALHVAAFHGQVEVAELLLARGALINAGDREGQTALVSRRRDCHSAAPPPLL